jgi:hypothetical protein
VDPGRGDHGWRFGDSTARSSDVIVTGSVQVTSERQGGCDLARGGESQCIDRLPHHHTHELLRVGSSDAC